MRITKILARNKNDYSYEAICEHCDKKNIYGDGYADHFYATQVIPNRRCSYCGKNSYGDTE